MTDDELLAKIASENAYALAAWIDPPEAGDARRWAALHRFIYTVAILTGTRRSLEVGYDDRWCFESAGKALSGLMDWRERGHEGEPDGWHRHPGSGRRRNEAGEEHVWL